MSNRFLPVLLLSSMMSASAADEVIPLAKVDVDKEQDRLAELLHVRQLQIRCTAARPYKTATLVVDCYHDGEKVFSRSTGLGGDTPHEAVSVSCQSVDLDRLPLGPSKPGHVRMSMKMTTDHSEQAPAFFSATEFDIDKWQCDVSKVNGASYWPKHAPASDGTTPLYWQMRCVNRSMTTGASLQQLLDLNPGADILIVSLRLTD